jgi:hypothetical protein
MVDHEDFVPRSQRLRERKTDFTATDDDDPHEGGLYPLALPRVRT